MTLINKEDLIAAMEKYYKWARANGQCSSDETIIYSGGLFETVRDFKEASNKPSIADGAKSKTQ